MGLVSSITKPIQKVIDPVVKPEKKTADRGRSPSNLRRRFSPNRANSTRGRAESSSLSKERERTAGSPRAAGIRGRPVHLLPDSPLGSDRNLHRVPSTRRHSGRRRYLQESLNNTVDISDPPPVPTMPGKFQEFLRVLWTGKSNLTEHEKELRTTFEKLKKKKWADLTPAEKAKEERNQLANQKRQKELDLAKDLDRQAKIVAAKQEEADTKAEEAAKAKRRLERLQKRSEAARRESRSSSKSGKDSKAEKSKEDPGSPKAGKKTAKENKPIESPDLDEDQRFDAGVGNTENSSGQLSSQQASESGYGIVAPSSSKRLASDIQNRPQSHRSSTAPTPANPAREESDAPQRPSQRPRSNTPSSRPGKSEAEAGSRQRSRSDSQISAAASVKADSSCSDAQVPTRRVAGRSPGKQPLKPSQLRQVSNADEVKSTFSRQRAASQPRTARGEDNKPQEESQPAGKTPKPSQPPRSAAQRSKSGASKVQQQRSQNEKITTVQSSRTRKTTLASLTEENLKGASEDFAAESESVYDVQTVLNRGLGDNMRTIIEGMVPKSAADFAEDEAKRREAAREALEEEEMREQDKLYETQFNREIGDNRRTIVEGMMPMTSEDIRLEQRKWKSVKRQQLNDEEEAEQEKRLAHTEFNRGLGDMMRTNLEGMVPMTPQDIKEAAREKLEAEEMRLQEELYKTRFNRGLGDNMRTNLEGMEPKGPGSMTPDERRRANQAKMRAGTSKHSSES